MLDCWLVTVGWMPILRNFPKTAGIPVATFLTWLALQPSNADTPAEGVISMLVAVIETSENTTLD